MQKMFLLVSFAIFLFITPLALAQYFDDSNAITGQVSRTFTKIQPSVPVSITENVLAPAGTPLYEIRVDVRTLVLQGRIFVESTDAEKAKLDVLPGGVVYSYVNITQRNLDESRLETAQIFFRVPKVWMSQNNIGSTNVKMLRFNSEEWQELDTRIISDGGDNVAYEARTPGFSIFAIAGEVISVPQEPIPTVEEEQPQVVEIEPGEEIVEIKYRDTLMWIIIAIVIIVIIALLFIIPGKVIRRKSRK
jgi:PGF-pre-PGF domain-containing protein